jgi:hypothetical protein
MPNYNPNTQGIQENRGVKRRLNKKEFTIKLLPSKKDILEEIALEFGYNHGGKGSLSALLEAIADDELMLVQTPPSRRKAILEDDNSYFDAESDLKKAIKREL